MTSSPRWQCVRTETRLPIVPVGTKSAASFPVKAAAVSSSLLTVGSSP